MKNKSSLLKKDILHLAKLANLKLSGVEITKYEKQFKQTLDYIDNLDKLKTDKIPTTDHVVNLTNVTFDDGKPNVRGLTQEQALTNTKKKGRGYFVVPKVL